MPRRSLLIVFCTTCLLAFQSSAPQRLEITPEIRAALDRIRPAAMRGDLSFLSSDLLEGRNTPSRGLDLAAEYIAAQFRGIGLEPAGDDGYFQTARMVFQEANMDGFELKLAMGDRSLTVAAKDAGVSADAAFDCKGQPVFKLDTGDAALVESVTPEKLAGKVVFLEVKRGQPSVRVALQKLTASKPALTISLARGGLRAREGKLADPTQPAAATPLITVSGASAVAFYDALKPGDSGATATLHLPAPNRAPVSPRTVIGILRGSDPVLKDTYVLLTAHYDHIGVRPEGTPGDRIFNGANDDGSGTVSVIEIARALSGMKQRPRRSIVFMTFWGEEEGMVGSRYYARHPVLPLDKTVGQLNLEQLGRTDDSEGPQVGTVSMTGFDYTTLSSTVRAAGEAAGVKVWKHPRNSDLYFLASDNAGLAEVGVPAHTLSVSFEFPDYHRVGDEWQKIDYENMARVDRAVALALITVAESTEAPKWDETNSKTEKYRKARH